MRLRNLFLLFILTGLFFLAACASKKDEEDALRLGEIEGMIQAVFNEDQSDLAAGLSLEELAEIGEALKQEDETELSEENAEFLEQLKAEFQLTNSMFELDLAFRDLLDDGVLAADMTREDLDLLAEMLSAYESKAEGFFNRLSPLLEEALDQFKLIEEARALVDELFENDGPASGVSREEEAEAREAVQRLVNEEIRTELLEALAEVDKFLAGQEEAERKAEEERRKKEEKERKRKEEEERRKQEEEERRAKSIGDFAGYYISDEIYPYICEVTEERFDCFVPESDILAFSTIKEIVHNTGTEITLILEDDETGETRQQKYSLLDGGKILKGYEKLYRITEEEFYCRADGC